MKRSIWISLTLLLLSLVGCERETAKPGDPPELRPMDKPQETEHVSLTGAGATFPYPLYSKWMAEYNRQHPSIRIDYRSIGSAGGIQQMIAGTVDFGATDAPMSADETARAKGRVLHIPTTLGAVVLAYNLPAMKEPLQLTPVLVTDIYLGKIKKWNDPRLVKENSGQELPNQAVGVTYRSDGSGTTAVFTDYLSSVSAEWKDKIGVGKSVHFSVGFGVIGNEGVARRVKTTPGSIGYIELGSALQHELAVARIRNRAGQYVEPKINSITVAARGVKLPESLYTSIVDAAREDAYPIAAYTYLLVYEDMKEVTKAKALAKFLWWAVHDGQAYCESLHYAPLPALAVARVEGALKRLRSGDQMLLSGP